VEERERKGEEGDTKGYGEKKTGHKRQGQVRKGVTRSCLGKLGYLHAVSLIRTGGDQRRIKERKRIEAKKVNLRFPTAEGEGTMGGRGNLSCHCGCRSGSINSPLTTPGSQQEGRKWRKKRNQGGDDWCRKLKGT